MKKLLPVFFLLPVIIYAQNTIGLPDVINYNKQSYGAGLQNWDFVQDKNGILYIANNEGLLSFDGKNFKTFALPNKTIVRSVAIANNKIFVGGQDEIGFFEPDKQGKLFYTSLVKLLPEAERSFGDVWDITAVNNQVYFRAPLKIFCFDKNSFTTFRAPQEWAFMGYCNGKLYAQDYSKGLMELYNNAWKPVFEVNNLQTGDPVTSILSLTNNTALVTTLKSGLFVLNEKGVQPIIHISNKLFINERVYAACNVTKERIALATSNNGVYIIDHNYNIVQRFSKTEGLQNKNVLSIFTDAQYNLWLGLDNGIDLVTYNSAIKQIVPLQQDGSGYTATIHDNKLFAGTSGGLFSVPLANMKDLSFTLGKFDKVKNTEGQIWRLAEINNTLLLGNHDGAYTIKNDVAKQISKNAGFWNFVPLQLHDSVSDIIAGNYKGITLFNYKDGNFIQQSNIPDFIESSRFIAIDDNAIWVSHPYHGVYKIIKKENGIYSNKLYNDKQGLPSALNNHIYKIKEEVIVATEKGIYIYNTGKDIFEPSVFYKKLLGSQSIRYIKEDKQGNIWFIHEKTLGVVDMQKREPSIIYIPELSSKLLSGFEFIYPVDSFNILLGAERGFFHINYAKYKINTPQLQAQINAVTINNKVDSLLFGGYFNGIDQPQKQTNILSIDNNWKTIRFEFSVPLFGFKDNLEYSYRLKGFDDTWSEYGKKTLKEYTNLPAGNYSFEVKARNNFGKESVAASYSFKILPPWYLAIWAKILYVLIFTTGLYILYRWLKRKFRNQRAKYEQEQQRLLYIHELEINKNESELVALRNEKLEAEINYKNSEMASNAMHLVKKGELLTRVKTELTQVMKEMQNAHVVHELKKLIRSLSDDDKMDEEWENFTRHFDKVHGNFVMSLKEKHPSISGNEVKLCAYLRMNLSTKEIAQLLNISVRGVEISRYRLRKKLQLTTDINLFDYLINIGDK